MTHKKFQNIRYICLFALLALIVAFICVIVSSIQLSVKLLVFFGILFLVVILTFGRVFCGFLCPLGLIADLVWKITEALHLQKISRNEKIMKVLYLLNKVFFCFFICGITSLIVILIFFPTILNDIQIPIYIPIIICSFVVIINIFARRLFCNICPIGLLVGLLGRINIIKLKKKANLCVMCGACYEACPMRIKSIYTEINDVSISDFHCIYCGECIKKCPEDDALSLNLGSKKIYKSSREAFLDSQFDDVK